MRLGDVERDKRDARVQMLDADSRYWLALGELFDTFLARTASAPLEDLAQVRTHWQQASRQAAERALHRALTSLATDARTRQALA
ncbi:hypothetical protein [Hymenobacter sp. CRA2]|uniref:hypothetical protein n=1 Tax=Hymenobacter sp. CRA2 TaxID=1955620 RepID=UPI00098F6E7B|nr:hypothetical protein [Hymenobacter sp. CRA2]OON68131.1 hypothetical protein B0919_15905 [Hymenobacter sp. CRA2]